MSEFKKLSEQELLNVIGGKKKKHRYQIYNNGMPTGRYVWR